MAKQAPSSLHLIIEQYESEILTEWLRDLSRGSSRRGTMSDGELRSQATEFLTLLRRALRSESDDIRADSWQQVREMLGGVSRSRGAQGFTPSETASFVFSLKKPLLSRLAELHKADAPALARDTSTLSSVLDDLGLFTTEVYQEGREEVIQRQQQDMLELSTPVVKLWEGILALPMIGTLDSARTQVVMETLLERIVETGAEIAIIDITGVPTVDTLTAQHLIKTVTAARLMGAECIISGIRPQIAQTIVHLGVDLEGVVTKANLADAFAVALSRNGLVVSRARTATAGISSTASMARAAAGTPAS